MKDSAMEAELRAAKERAVVPLETRITQFREMLSEKEVFLYKLNYYLIKLFFTVFYGFRSQLSVRGKRNYTK